MARHVRFHEIGSADVLKIDEVPTPDPAAKEVLVRVRALGLNRAESMYRSGRYIMDPIFPATLGFEASGIIESLGSDVTEFKVGDEISVMPTFSFADYGLYGDLVVAPLKSIIKKPQNISWETATATWMPYLTAWGALIHHSNLSAGHFVVISAASSSVALAAMDIAHSVGATPIMISRTGEKNKALENAGAKYILQLDKHDIYEEIMQITEGKGVEAVFDPVTGPLLEILIKCCRQGGNVAVYGALSHDATTIPVMDMIARQINVFGYVFMEVTNDEALFTKAKDFIVDGLTSGKLNVQIAKTFKFEEIIEATKYLESNAQFGKVVVTLD